MRMDKQKLVSITNQAIDQVKQILHEYHVSNGIIGYLRIGIKERGCKGISYSIEIIDSPIDSDEVLEFDNITLYVSSEAFMWIIGTTIDYAISDCEEKFVFDHPGNAKLCHCKEAFYRS